MKKLFLSFICQALTVNSYASGIQDSIAEATSDSVRSNAQRSVTNIIENATGPSNDIQSEIPSVAIIVPVAFFAFILLLIGIGQFFKYKRNKDRNNLFIKYLETGKDIPVELLKSESEGGSNLKRGIVLISVGIGVSAFFFSQDSSNAWTMGLIPFLLGIGYLVVHRLSTKKENTTNE